MEPILVAKPAYHPLATFFAWLLAVSYIVATVGLVAAGAPWDAAVTMVASGALLAAVIAAVLPLRYEVAPEALVIVLRLWRWRIPWTTIELVRRAETWKAFAYWGVRFATDPEKALEVRRSGGFSPFRRPSVIISPEAPDAFAEAANAAIRRARDR